MSLDFIFNIFISDYAGNKHYHIIFYWFEFMRVSSAGPSKYFRSTQILPRTSCSSKQRNPWIRGKLFLICMQKHSSMNHIIADHDCIFFIQAKVSELWYVEEYDLLALALDGRMNVRRFPLECSRPWEDAYLNQEKFPTMAALFPSLCFPVYR